VFAIVSCLIVPTCPQEDLQGSPPYKKLVINGEVALTQTDDKTLQQLIELLMFLDETREQEKEDE